MLTPRPPLSCTSSVLGFLITILDTVIFKLRNGHNPGVVLRNYSQMEFLVLKLTDLFTSFPGMATAI